MGGQECYPTLLDGQPEPREGGNAPKGRAILKRRQSLVALLLSVPIYPFFMNSMEASAKRKQEIGLATAAEPI